MTPKLRTLYAWELRKLRAQRRTYLGLAVGAALPIVFVVAIALQRGEPDVPFGAAVRDSGLAVPLVILTVGSYWLFPLVTALVAGDIVAAEDHNGTLKTILTRSAGRDRIFAAKALAAGTYAAAVLALTAGVALVAGVLASGLDPLTTLSGATIRPEEALRLTAASLLVYLMPLLTVGSIALLLSTVTHNSAAAVVGALMASLLLQVLEILPGLDALRPYLLPAQNDAWQGLLRSPPDWAPALRAAWICAAHALPCLAVAASSFRRRDVTGG